jgi:hypothetical protein
MIETNEPVVGTVASLHMHPAESGKGILNNTRYFDTINATGLQNRNHVSLIDEREQIADHGLSQFPAGTVLSNVESGVIHIGGRICLIE